jgi:hypothetical protein
VGGSDFAALTRTSCGRSIEMCQQPEELAKSKTESRTPLTSRPVGSISRSHRDPSLRADLGSMALRARVAAYSAGGGSAASVTSPVRWGPPPRSSQKCGAASPSGGRSAGGGGGRGRPRSQPTARQIPQRGQKRVQLIPVLGRGHPVMLGGGPLPEHQAGVRGRPGSSLRR